MTTTAQRTTAQPSDTATPQAFGDATAAVASPVAVVTVMDGDRPHGTTVSACASPSLTPPMVLMWPATAPNSSQAAGFIEGR